MLIALFPRLCFVSLLWIPENNEKVKMRHLLHYVVMTSWGFAHSLHSSCNWCKVYSHSVIQQGGFYNITLTYKIGNFEIVLLSSHSLFLTSNITPTKAITHPCTHLLYWLSNITRVVRANLVQSCKYSSHDDIKIEFGT